MDIHEILQKRHSIREYAHQSVTANELKTVIEAARIAPSACNRQPWHFYAINKTEILDKIKQTYNRDWFAKAPAVIVVCGNHNESWHRPSDNKDHCDIDVAIAIDHLIIKATEINLGTCWVCNFDAPQLSAAMQLDNGIEPIALIPIGHLTNKQPKATTRKSIEDIATFLCE